MIILICMAILAGCGTQTKRPSQDVLIAEQAMKHVERLQAAYSARDLTGLETLCTPEAFSKIRFGIKPFSSVDIKMDSQWIDINTSGEVELRIAWAGRWHLEKGLEATDNGTAVFIIAGSPLKLSKVRGSSPFDAPSGAARP